MSHSVTVCERGFVHTQCRCAGPHKDIKTIECNGMHKSEKGRYWDDPRIIKFVVTLIAQKEKELKELLNR